MKNSWKYKWYKFIKFMGLEDLSRVAPPVLVEKSELININDLMDYHDILDVMTSTLIELEESEEGCHCFQEGFGEATALLAFLIDEQLLVNINTAALHQEVEEFLKKRG